MSSVVVAAVGLLSAVNGLNNGLARTPPMGWLSWEVDRCHVDCAQYPTSCINADLYQQMADRLAGDGYKDVGYTQVNIDDCWNTFSRDPNTNEQMANSTRFPKGIAGVAEYVHSKGLKLGLYNDIGSESCASYTGINGNWDLDAKTFASWDIDMIKIDGCYESTKNMYQDYPAFGKALNGTGRPIIYSCSWPAYVSGHGETVPPVDHTTMAALAENCNLWRNYDDIQGSFSSIMGIVEYWRRDYHNYYNDSFLNVAGPGNWNDPDMIIVGDPGLSMGEQETQFALWAIFAAPLLMSNDLRTISTASRELLLNEEIIAVNQDPLGKQGGYIWMNTDKNPTQVIWMRELQDADSIAVVLQNTGAPAVIAFQSFLVPSFVKGWDSNTAFTVRNLLNHTDLGHFGGYFPDTIDANSVGMYKITISK